MGEAQSCMWGNAACVESYISEAMRRIGSQGDPDVTKNTERQEAWESAKKDSRESRVSTTGHNIYKGLYDHLLCIELHA